ncbi:MAG: proteic killer suppression protein [Marinobacter sp. T13-3]|jgi:proteic killer suppression protein|nr:MAG: proteic killer suppression protein [Marinobacter sp. T13-3]
MIKIIPSQRTETVLLDWQHVWHTADHVKKLRMQLAALDTATSVEDMDIPGFRLHPLKGKDKGRWSIRVNGNWRMTFEFQDGNAYILDYEDYH